MPTVTETTPPPTNRTFTIEGLTYEELAVVTALVGQTDAYPGDSSIVTKDLWASLYSGWRDTGGTLLTLPSVTGEARSLKVRW